MSKTFFETDEITSIDDCCRRVPLWHHWRKRVSASGNEVIEIAFAASGPARLMLMKTEDGCFAAAGFDGWSVTVSEELSSLLAILARMTPTQTDLQSRDRERSAA